MKRHIGNFEVLEVVVHKTHEITKLILPERCDLIITMNITNSLLSEIATPETEIYFISAYKDPRKRYKAYSIGMNHAKIYRTPTRIIISSANLSLSSWVETSIIFKRNSEIDKVVESIKRELKPIEFLSHAW